MDDKDIIRMFQERSESAINALGDKYSKYCLVIAVNILGNMEDANEILNDTYHKVWNAIPPEEPESLRAYIGCITRNLSLDRHEKAKAEKRGGGQLDAILSELEECIADSRNSFDELIEQESITVALNAFLAKQSILHRRIFIHRYWKASSIEEIAECFGVSIGNVKVILSRMRRKLRKYLEIEGIIA